MQVLLVLESSMSYIIREYVHVLQRTFCHLGVCLNLTLQD